MGKSTISLAIFNSYVWHNQRVICSQWVTKNDHNSSALILGLGFAQREVGTWAADIARGPGSRLTASSEGSKAPGIMSKKYVGIVTSGCSNLPDFCRNIISQAASGSLVSIIGPARFYKICIGKDLQYLWGQREKPQRWWGQVGEPRRTKENHWAVAENHRRIFVYRCFSITHWHFHWSICWPEVIGMINPPYFSVIHSNVCWFFFLSVFLHDGKTYMYIYIYNYINIWYILHHLG